MIAPRPQRCKSKPVPPRLPQCTFRAAGRAGNKRAAVVSRLRFRGMPHFRITFSDGVSASMNADRLKMRSAYFISGAAWRGSCTP